MQVAFYVNEAHYFNDAVILTGIWPLSASSPPTHNHILPSPTDVQAHNALIHQVNEVSKQIMQEMSLPYLDAYKISSDKYAQTLQSDAIHFQEEYFQEICHILLSDLNAVFGKA